MFFGNALIAANDKTQEHVYDNIRFSIITWDANKVPIHLLELHGSIK
jgi:hypothetical protein